MMTKMKLDGLQFDEVLKRAQDKGYAERNPAADIEGHDASRKIAILTSLAYGQQVDYEDIHTEGITKISDIDVEYANRLGRAIKLLGSSEKTAEGKVFAIVAPKMIKESNPLFMVSGVFNAILIEGNMLGEVMCYGKGAGKLPTASAVVSDVIDAAKHAGKNIPIIWTREKLELGSFSDMKHAFFLRIPAYKKAEALDRLPVNTVLEDVKAGEIGIVTELMTEGEFEKASAELGVISMIRYEL